MKLKFILCSSLAVLGFGASITASAQSETELIAAARATYPLKTCVVSNEKLDGLDDAVAHVHRAAGQPERVLFLCCEGCIDDFKKDPARYLQKLDAAGKSKSTATSSNAPVRFENAAQPQLAVSAEGTAWLVFGRGTDVFVSRSTDGGTTFSQAVNVATVPGLMLGRRRGPRIAANGDDVTVTLNAKDLLAFHSGDGGRTWTGPATINGVAGCAREGLHDLAASADGRVFVTWLDLRNGKMELFGAESRDRGRTWGPNQQLYVSPGKSICECCHPTAYYDRAGNLAIMWRNSIEGARDMWMMTRSAGSAAFSAARKLGEGTWKLEACPMDGGDVCARGNGEFGSVWQRGGEVFYHDGAGAELRIGKGKQPVAATLGSSTLIVWEQGPDLWLARPESGESPLKRVAGGRFASIATLPNGTGALVAYEQGGSVAVEKL